MNLNLFFLFLVCDCIFFYYFFSSSNFVIPPQYTRRCIYGHPSDSNGTIVLRLFGFSGSSSTSFSPPMNSDWIWDVDLQWSSVSSFSSSAVPAFFLSLSSMDLAIAIMSRFWTRRRVRRAENSASVSWSECVFAMLKNYWRGCLLYTSDAADE